MPRNKLTLEDVEEIKRLYKSGDVSMNQLALIYAVDTSTIHRAIREYTHRAQKTFGEAKALERRFEEKLADDGE